MYKNYLKTYQDKGEVKLTFDEWCTQNGGGLCESDLTKAQEAYEKYSNDFDISSVQFNKNNPNEDINSVKFNQTIKDEEELFNQGPIVNQQNLSLIKSMGNPYYLGMGDNPFLDLAGAIYDSVEYWKEKDLSKQRPPYPVDPTGKFIINAELQEKYPNSPTKFFQTPDEYEEYVIQKQLNERAELYPELYQKEKVDLEEYRKTGKRDFKKKKQTMKLGDRLEMFEYPDAEYINYDESGNPTSYFKTVDGEMQEFPISLKGITEPIEMESIPLDSNFRFPVDTDFELAPRQPIDMVSLYGNPRFDINAENAGIESDFSSYDDDELIEERFGGSLPKAQSKGEIDLNLLNIEDCTGGGCRDTGDTSTGISLFTGLEGSNQENALIQAGLKGGVTARNSSNIGFSLTGEAGFQNNLKDLLTNDPNPSAFHSGKLNVGYKNRPLYVGNQQYPGDNIGVYGEYDSNYGISTGIEGGFGPLNIQAGYNFNSQSPYVGGSLKFNLKNGGALPMYQNGDDVEFDDPEFDFMEGLDLSVDEDIYDDPFENANPEDLDDEGFFIIEEEPEEEEEIEYYTPPEDDPEDSMFDGTTDDIELETDGDAVYTVGTDGDDEFQRMSREDKKAIRRANRSGFGEKVANTLDKIGTTAVNIAKPITRYLRQRQERKRRRRMGLGYLSDNVFSPTDADLSGSKGDYDPNTGIFRPDDKVISRLGRYGTELPQADIGTEFVANRYPGFDDLTADEQNQVLNQYNVGNNRSFGNNYSDQYLETMDFKNQNNIAGYNPAISQLPSWMSNPNEGYGRIVIDDEMERYMKGQIAGGNLSPGVAEEYARYLAGHRGDATVIDYKMDDYNRYLTFDDEKRAKFTHYGGGYGYQEGIPGAGVFNTVGTNVGPAAIESLLELSDRVNVSRYPNLDQDAIDADNKRDFNRMVSREAYNIRKEETAEADEYFKNLRLKPIEEEPEEEEDISLYDFTYPGGNLDEIKLTDERPPIEAGMLNEIVLTDTAPPSTTLQPRGITSVTPNKISNNIPIIERGTIPTNTSNIVDSPTNNTNITVKSTTSNINPTEYIPQSEREQKEYVPQSKRNDKEYTPQSQENKALYGGTFFGTGGEAEIDINTYKALIDAGADIEII
jgi:hypothetical protein